MSAPLVSDFKTHPQISDAVSDATSDPISLCDDPWLGEEMPKLEYLPKPKLWRVIVKQIGIKKKIVTASGHEFLMPDQVIADQEWTHGMCVVVKVGTGVYRGRKFEDLLGDQIEKERPWVGGIYSFEARQPKRFKIDGVQLIELSDDALTMEFDRRYLDKVSFQVG